METPNFDVVISGSHMNPEAWQSAGDARKSELGETEKLQTGEAFQRQRGAGLGRRIQEILASLGANYSLVAVVRQGVELRWIAKIEAGEKTVAVALPLDLVDDVIDSGAAQELVRLRNLVLFGVGRQELISKH